ncbi:MAG: flagellar hook-length control protein FliK [Planctomycetota bacterium]
MESDPFRIPIVGDGKRAGDSFARQLDAALERHPDELRTEPELPRRLVDEPVADSSEASVQAAPAAPCAPPADPIEPAPEPDAPDADSVPVAPFAQATLEPQTQTAPRSTASATTERGEPTANPGAPRPAQRALAAEPAPVAADGHAAFQAAGAAVVPTTARSSSPGLASLAHGEVRGIGSARAAAGVGYRSVDKLALDRVETARDSVLRQIVFKLQDGRSEAHMQLEPPELGLLDLQLVVDGAGQTKLSLIAERPEIASLLQHNLPLLASSLAQQGLTITQADVRSGDGRARRDSQSGAGLGSSRATYSILDSNDDAPPVRAVAASTGLDFWA